MSNSFADEGTIEHELLRELCEWEWDEDGEDIDGMVENFSVSSVVPGICSDLNCKGITTRIEPDQHKGWCHQCEKNTVKSVLVLAGMA